jgi:Arm DNA-binding domain
MDSGVGGLGLRVTPAGHKTFIYYRCLPQDNENAGKICELKIGTIGGMTIEQACARAKALNSIVENGKRDPSRPPDDEQTYDWLFNRYIEEYAKTRTVRWENLVYNHGRYFKRWHGCPVAKITRQKVQYWVNDMGEEFGKATANRNYNTMRAIISWALRKDIITRDNPCIGVDTFRLRARERFFNQVTSSLDLPKR